MAHVGKENWQETLPLPGTSAEPGRKESMLLAASALGSSKIPVRSKGRLPPELKPLQLKQGQLQQACPSSVGSKAIKAAKVPYMGSVPGAAILEAEAGLLPKSLSRGPLGEMQLSTSGHRNEGSRSTGKEANATEFEPDLAALASILSNTGLTNHMVSATHKPSLARRVPLRGNRACSAGVGTARGSLHSGAPAANLVRMSHISRSTSKDTDHRQSCSLALNTQQLRTLSTTFKSFGVGVELAKPNQPTESLGTGKCKDVAARYKAESLSSVTGAGVEVCSDSAGRKDITGTSWKDEDFVPDLAAKASILLNVGLSHSALGANGKLSLAQRVPVKDVRKPPISCGSTRGENAFPLVPQMSTSSTGKFGRVSCRSTQGLKGLERAQASGAQFANTPGDRCSAVDYSPYGLARRVPVTCPRSLRRGPWTGNQFPVSSCAKDKRVGTRNPIESEQVKWTSRATPKVGTLGSKQEGTAVPWEKIAVRLFDDETAAAAKKARAVPVIPPGMEKLQRIELLAQLLQREMNDGLDCDAAPSLEELHKLLSAHCSPPPEAPKPEHCTHLQDPGPDACKLSPVPPVAVMPGPCAKPATSSQQPVCPSPSMHSLRPPSSHTSSTGQAKQRLDDLLSAPQRFHEACLNDECAFYTARAPPAATQPPVQRCKEPVAKTLDAHDAMHFIPISVPVSPPLMEGERSSPS